MRFGFVLLSALVVLGGCRKKAEPLRDPKLENKVAAREVTLYFESNDLLLVPEKRTLALPEREAAAIPLVVRELVKGSANAAVPKMFPPDVVVRGAYSLPDGTAIVDLGSAAIGTTWSPGSHGELMSMYSIVQTITTNFSSIQRVRLLVNGQIGETFAGHIRLDRPLRPMPSLVSTNPAATIAVTSQPAPAAALQTPLPPPTATTATTATSPSTTAR